ncbi:NADPH-dependent FMN reductase [Tuwongella immobilis]|uniref:NADPH-dependent FMN reductase-like domain-containing protein n=1 Tax=Tuwongella immobilis TaxID=692036 RepID=A0A6C2YQS3_9BACT|nr:NADPH-dependent FMN reductase [Tuwongella immobilis]VIP03707.1 flavoprotein : NADPH-dependent FMN reductase OS=Coraliomargarita akajimensis (strain DSM 45221 / IAM 15411 / JCM 23193 / KCTC 12865) GN=Caka_1042 PE=4 SV=1: FMN_red [Tuwongella immobilis]VTS04782.1 flavoprotein : NADPH-dependent FMN reductase OS=Coraliomargarita akajimensis (strain DSM 45221 / IAM 15411 / JCM 23193 / KCTC 12865) GN=Caka_1042 PE=4 SV=1: FMN_red [Tuwongella immobilis]
MITILSGTNRPGSTTRKLVDYLATVYQSLDVTPTIVDLQELPAEAFLPSVYEKKPESLKPFTDAIMHAQGVVIVTPEYNGGFPGVLKYFIDMLPHPAAFQKRPVCLVGVAAGEWGALRPVEQLQGLLSYRGAYQFPDRVFVRNCGAQLAASGIPVAEDLQKRFSAQAEAFLAFVKRFHPAA